MYKSLKGLLALRRKSKLNGGSPSPSTRKFDPQFYRQHYTDAAHLGTDAELERHFREAGSEENRFANGEEMVEALKLERGPLPVGFDADEYRSVNKDLSFMRERFRLEAHYLHFGRAENRKYLQDVESYDSEYRGHARKYGDSDTCQPGGFRQFLQARGITSILWLSRFNLGEFLLLNADWLPAKPRTRMEALCWFAEQGVWRLAPIAAAWRFDPAFYRSTPDAPAEAGDVDLYRHWLNIGMPRGAAGSEEAFLRDLIEQDTFPTCFDEEAYRIAARDGTMPAGRAQALAHYVRIGFAAGIRGIVGGPGSARFYAQLGRHYLRASQNGLALSALERAASLAPSSGPIRHARGDALRALGRPRDAVDDFLFAASQPDADVSSHIHAAEGLAVFRGDPQSAMGQIARSAPLGRGSDSWRAMAHRVIAQAFEADARRALALYSAGRRDEADATVVDSLARVTESITVIDPLPARLPRPSDGPVVIIANRELPQCDHYRVTQKSQQLLRGGWKAEIYDEADTAAYRPALDRAQAVIFYRVAARPAIIHAILYANALGVRTIYEVDDLIFDPKLYPDPFASFEGQITPADYASLQLGVPLFRHAISLCDVGLASTPALAEAIRPLVRSRTCHVLRNGLDARNAPYLDAPPIPLAPDAVTIFYGSGTKAHNLDFTELAAPALLTALERHPQVRLVVAGHLRLDDRFAALSDRIHRLEFTADVEAYWEVLSGIDINLAVLAPGATTDAKSEIKWLEAAACAVPSIVSSTRTYREILVDGEDALLAGTPDEWSTALERLISDPVLRRRIGMRARAKARANYSLDVAADTLSTFLAPPAFDARPSAAHPRPRAASPRPTHSRSRILLVHVFFPPQDVGGATRVVRDNVDYLIDHAASALDLAVVTTDAGVETPYRTRVDAYRGVPVYRIAAPREPHMDWRPFDPNMRGPFEDILDRFDPDLVHVHCIQHLTGSVVEIVRARGTPYLVTLHDAWWISDFQFLVNADDQLCLPSPDPLGSGSDSDHGLIRSIARRRRLGRLLDGARMRLAVSEAFAVLYRQAGFPDTRALPNGVSRFTPMPRYPRRDDRVHLGHVGNRSAHKGATLVEVVLRTTPLRNLALTMVEHGREAGYLREETWGTTPVRIIGPTPQAEIASLYATFDVLLAPSLWPESFGLVTREAQAAGLWVVASDRGAIGENIREGIDGYRIDVSDAEGLRNALRCLDAQPERYRVPPPAATRPMRLADDQGADLLALYEDLLDRRSG